MLIFRFDAIFAFLSKKMMDHELISSYDRHKKEAQRILNKITNRHYQELQRIRSEGFEIVDDLKEDLRKCFRRAATHRVSRCIRRKQMTEHFEKFQVKGQEEKRKFSCPRLRRKTMIKRMTLVKNQIDFLSRRTSKKSTILEHVELDKLLMEVQESLNNSKTEISKQEEDNLRGESVSESESAQQKEEVISDDQAIEQTLAHYHENKTFLPMLEFYIQQRFFLKTMSREHEKTCRIITQMILLAIARRRNRKLLDSLDILISIDSFFPKNSHQMEQLKSTWYQLIAAVFLEIKSQEKKEKASRWKTGPQRSSIKASVEMRRQKTIIIRSLASKRNFYDRVSAQLKKMDLIHETTYLKEQKDFRNMVQNSQKGRLILSRINNSCILSYPQPRCLFPDFQGISNYGIVFVSRDKQTNLFPNHYPIALSNIISQEEYISVFCKINSVLVPETKCFTFDTTLNFNYEYIFIIILLLFFGVISISVLVRKYGSNSGSYFVIFLIFILILLLCLKMHRVSHSSFGKSNQSYHSIKKMLQNWGDSYNSTIKLTLSDSSDIIIISYPKEIQSESIISEAVQEGSYQRIALPQRLRTLRCSSNQKFLHQIQDMVRTNKSSEQTDSFSDSAQEIVETNEQHGPDHHFDNFCREEERASDYPDSFVDIYKSSHPQPEIPEMKASLFADEFDSQGQNP